MGAIEGISSVSNATSASFQTKPSVQTNSVEAVTVAASGTASANIATQVSTVQGKASDGNSGSSQERKEATHEQVKKAVEKLNREMNKNTSCQFGMHEETNRVTIKIVDNETKEVVKEFPPEETLDMIAKVWEIAGIMVDEKL